MDKTYPKEIQLIQAALVTKSLPGWEAQKLMSPMFSEKYRAVPEEATPSAILLTLYKNELGNWSTLYIKRASKYEGDKHKGQISFPGGKQEPTDLNSAACAIRECEEEIGIDPKHIKLLGALSPLYVFVSGFIIYPYIAYIPHLPTLNPDPSEVDYVIDVPLSELFLSKSIRDFSIRGMKFKDSPYYALKNEVLWGATAMITSEFEQLTKALNIKF